MAEKYLKAFLVAKKRWFPKIHPVSKLLEFCMDIDISFDALREEAIFLTEFYVETRYPGDYPEFSWQEAEQAFAAAQSIEEFVLEKIKKQKKQ